MNKFKTASYVYLILFSILFYYSPSKANAQSCKKLFLAQSRPADLDAGQRWKIPVTNKKDIETLAKIHKLFVNRQIGKVPRGSNPSIQFKNQRINVDGVLSGRDNLSVVAFNKEKQIVIKVYDENSLDVEGDEYFSRELIHTKFLKAHEIPTADILDVDARNFTLIKPFYRGVSARGISEAKWNKESQSQEERLIAQLSEELLNQVEEKLVELETKIDEAYGEQTASPKLKKEFKKAFRELKSLYPKMKKPSDEILYHTDWFNNGNIFAVFGQNEIYLVLIDP